MSLVAFDTHALVKKLQEAGFTEQQAEAQVSVLKEALSANLEALATREGLETAKIYLEGKIKDVETRLEARITQTETRLKEEMAALRQGLKDEMASLRQEFRDETTSLRQELKGEAASIRQELKGEAASIRQELRDETASLRQELTRHGEALSWLKWLMGFMVAGILTMLFRLFGVI